mgnify:CR=1 FL=1
MQDQLSQAIKQELIRRICEESIPRILKCITHLSEEQLTWRPNNHTNSVANLILHLNGNVRQWLLASLLNIPHKRQRDQEFLPKTISSQKELELLLQELNQDIRKAALQLNQNYLESTFSIQGFKEKGISIVMHVMEHFSYHTGQITYITKQLQDLDTDYYSGFDLNQQNQ